MWLNELRQRWMGQTPRQRGRRGPASRMQKRLTLEALEERMLLSNPASTADLIAAINSANSSGTLTNITLKAGVLFGFSSSDNSTDGGNALPIITGNIVITGNGDMLTRSVSTPFRLFEVASGATLNLQDMTLQNGLAHGTGTAAEGGAILSSGTLKLNGVAVQSNVAQGSNSVGGGNGASASGGGLYVAGGSLSLINGTVIANNRALAGNGANGGSGADGSTGGFAFGGGVYVASASSVALSDVTISTNFANGGNGGNGGSGGAGGQAGWGQGGGMYVAASSNFTLSNDTLSSNVALGGAGGNGGVGRGGGTAGAGEGGGLFLEGNSASLTNDTFNGNSANGGSGGNGGGPVGDSNGTGAGQGGAGEGGGLFALLTGSASLSDSTFSNNVAAGGDGGAAGTGGIGRQGAPGGNGGNGGVGEGGGLVVDLGSFTLTNDTFSGNSAIGGLGYFAGNGGEGSGSFFQGGTGGSGGTGGVGGTGAGGGLYLFGGTVSLNDDTISANSVYGGTGGTGGAAGGDSGSGFPGGYVPVSVPGVGGNGGNAQGGGVFAQPNNAGLGLANTLIAANSIVAGTGGTVGGGTFQNTNGTASGPDVSGFVFSSDDDLIGDPTGSNGFGKAGDLLGSSGSPLNPQLGPLADNGGPTQTMALLANSPAIDHGDSHAPGLPATDQRGFARIVGSAVDIGAFEFGATAATPGIVLGGSGLSSAAPGGPITYTLTVTNNSSTAQSNVSLIDQLPANATLVSWTPAAGWSSDAPPAGSSSGTVSAWLASLAPNSSATFTLVVQVTPGTTVGTVISNTASVAPFADVTNPGANSVGFNTTVLYAPTVQVVDAGGTYNGNPFPATATAVGIDGTTPVAGSFSYAYYAGSSASGTPLSTVPVNAGTYTVVATFTSNDADYSNGSAQTTFTISPAPISYTIGNDTQAYGWPANLAADLPSSFSTGIHGENLDITYSSSGDASTAPVGTYAITGVVSNGTGLTSNYSVTLTSGTLTVLGPGVTVVGTTLWIVGGTTTNDSACIDPVDSSKTGSTGVKVDAKLNGVHTSATYNQSFTALYIFLYGGNDDIQLAPTLTINATVSAGKGNDLVTAGNGSNAVTLGNGNDLVTAGNGSNSVTLGNGNDGVAVGNGANTFTLGNGNDIVAAGNGNNTIALGNGNDITRVGKGNNVIVEGNGNDGILAGNGDNLIVAGLGKHTVIAGNGSNILIDGSVQLTQSGDSLRQVLDDWEQFGALSTNVANIRSRLDVTYNHTNANTLVAGRGLDWFFATYAGDLTNHKAGDLLN